MSANVSPLLMLLLMSMAKNAVEKVFEEIPKADVRLLASYGDEFLGRLDTALRGVTDSFIGKDAGDPVVRDAITADTYAAIRAEMRAFLEEKTGQARLN